MDKDKFGVIYILTNPSFPEYVKIGYADDLEKRLNKLNRSECIPYAFRVYAKYETPGRLNDVALHKLIDQLNPSLRSVDDFDGKHRIREFYAMSAEDAYDLLDCIAKISGTEDRLFRMQPDGHEIIDEEKAEVIRKERRGAIKFTEIGIPVGSTICFINDESIQATVIDDRHIYFNGKETSVSAAAQELLHSKFPVQGTLYFTYNGETINDIRLRKENEE